MEQSEGGLATGLKGIGARDNTLWIGWPGTYLPAKKQEAVNQSLRMQRLAPVWLSPSDIDGYYCGFSNGTLWPLFHYFPSFASFDAKQWETYKAVNTRFAKEVLQHTGEEDTIWIHDYQLLLLPALIREKRPGARIGFFQHIPFPSPEIFRQLPWRDALLKGMLGADLIGFHTESDGDYFKSAVRNFVGDALVSGESITVGGRKARVGTFPMGIDYERYSEMAKTAATQRSERKIRRLTGNKQLIISVDRLDYSKGITERLKGYDRFLEQHPEFYEKVQFLQLVVPSRDNVKQYALLKEDINRQVSEINARRGSFDWQPVCYFYRAVPPDMLSALYTSAAVALVTPLRDGMNLVSKEFIASRLRQDGVLVLSELAGAARALTQAVTVNPFNIQDIADAIYQSLTMPLDEQQRRMRSLQLTVKRNDVRYWADAFLEQLEATGVRTPERNMPLPLKRSKVFLQYQYPPRA